ncbi:YolD-like family protein [Bacillus licheniformis]|uniref:YolD-like family protein n=1 Tax=Bacillus TaxID=1386 RepID=UPI0006718B24|nr:MULTISPECIES: YolD-like family protein [Bacillus]AKQ73978.1 putative phage-like protein [Bacillus licheniformis WX-02]MCD2526142.1 YolD-like family protein [Bacillus licheniformis]MCY9339736.1 YolD-like family protein [Bacillus haynesii]MDE1392115.1 YolD-like family protein [Bacillus paralicheniformis]MDE1397197.1 YolD-like family protein [Bacillus licheniformis]
MKDENLKDRGTIKWTAMMLPEHVSLIRELERSQNKVKRPVLDLAQIEDMEMIISEAMEFNNPVQFSVFKPLPMLNGPETGEIVQIEGHIHYINQLRRLFHVVDSKGDTNLIKFEDIVEVELK